MALFESRSVFIAPVKEKWLPAEGAVVGVPGVADGLRTAVADGAAESAGVSEGEADSEGDAESEGDAGHDVVEDGVEPAEPAQAARTAAKQAQTKPPLKL